MQDLAAATDGRILSIDTIPDDLFAAGSETKSDGTPLWPYLTFVFLFLLIAEVTARKFLNVD
jgi:hypothetical protein